MEQVKRSVVKAKKKKGSLLELSVARTTGKLSVSGRADVRLRRRDVVSRGRPLAGLLPLAPQVMGHLPGAQKRVSIWRKYDMPRRTLKLSMVWPAQVAGQLFVSSWICCEESRCATEESAMCLWGNDRGCILHLGLTKGENGKAALN